MKMWIARTNHGYLSLFDQKPVFNSKWNIQHIKRYGFDDDIEGLQIDKDEFPEVTFENSPTEVELVLKR